MQSKVSKNLLQIQEEIAPYKPNIIAVTKYFDEKAVIEAYQAGLRDFAESRVNDAIEKINRLDKQIRDNSRFHFIGHLQTNKVKKVVEYFDFIHSADSVRLAEIISREAQNQGKIQNILLQINISGEEQKFGFSPDEVFQAFEQIRQLPSINILGLMCMTPLGADESVLENIFSEAQGLKEKLESSYKCCLRELSMGMSQDYAVAVKYGATMLRIGRKLFK